MKPLLLAATLPLLATAPPLRALKAVPAAVADDPADTLALRDVEVTFHQAGSVLPAKDLELMMGLYADDALLTDTAHGNKVYTGKAEVRRYWEEVSGPFRPAHHWIGYTPAMRIKTSVHGDTGTLYFECLWMDVDTGTVGTHSFSDMKLTRAGGRWLVKAISVGGVPKL